MTTNGDGEKIKQMRKRGSLHSATDDEAVRRSGRDDGIYGQVEMTSL